jgi:hypothetical protein
MILLLVLAGVFQAKMIEAWLLLPALALPTKDPRMRWIATRCRDPGPGTFLCIAPDPAASPAGPGYLARDGR